MARLFAALKRRRHGQRDWLIGLLIYRHGLRVSEACDLRWDDLSLPKRTIIVRRSRAATTRRITWSGRACRPQSVAAHLHRQRHQVGVCVRK
jgi:integrase